MPLKKFMLGLGHWADMPKATELVLVCSNPALDYRQYRESAVLTTRLALSWWLFRRMVIFEYSTFHAGSFRHLQTELHDIKRVAHHVVPTLACASTPMSHSVGCNRLPSPLSKHVLNCFKDIFSADVRRFPVVYLLVLHISATRPLTYSSFMLLESDPPTSDCDHVCWLCVCVCVCIY